MGACGCGDYAGRWRIPGPDGKWYVIGVYQGCHDCGNPAGFFVDLMDEEDMKGWGAHELPIIGGPEHPNFGVPLIDLNLFEVALFKMLDDAGVNVGEDEDDRDAFRDDLDLQGLVGGVAWETAAAMDQQLAKHGVKIPARRRGVLQPWAERLTLMQQSVLIAAVRGPDGVRKDHVAKVLCRWLRRSFLISAFDRKALTDPYTPGGGSFTGPLVGYPTVEGALTDYFRHVDEIPHHFQLHLMHAAEILGYKHPDEVIRIWWRGCYARMANDMHLVMETEEAMDRRLGDVESLWRAAEEVTAR